MFRYCPGARSIVNPRIIITKCPYCGGEIEFFEYETEITCWHCGRTVRRNPSESCIFWCNAAIDCIKNLKELKVISEDVAYNLINLVKRYRESKS